MRQIEAIKEDDRIKKFNDKFKQMFGAKLSQQPVLFRDQKTEYLKGMMTGGMYL